MERQLSAAAVELMFPAVRSELSAAARYFEPEKVEVFTNCP